MVFKVFLRKIISTISKSSYTSQIHCKNALRLDPVFMVEHNSFFQVIFQAKLARVNFLVSQCYRDELLVTITPYDIGCPYRYDYPLRDELLQ